MNISLQKTLHQLTGHSNIADAGIDELFQLTDSHPYFALPHFFLTQKLKDEKHQAYISQLQKTALYFTNPYWLHYQLMNNNAAMEVLHKQTYHTEETKPLLEQVIEEEIQQSITHAATTAEHNEIETVKVDEQPVFDEPIVEPVISQTAIQEEPITATVLTETIVAETVAEEPVQHATEIVQPITGVIEEPQEFHPSVTSFALESAEVAETANHSSTNVTEQKEEELTEVESNEEVVEIHDQKIASILKEQLEEFKKPVTEATVLQIESEPFHTVDYFASQGIKPEYDHADQDVLSKQLRRFTDWLKHMKNVPPSNEDLGTDPELESAIQGIAQTSNEAKEIVTETMAEVLVKQGKIDKAIQLYIKLSFLNPDKSAYFASKIQSLKGI